MRSSGCTSPERRRGACLLLAAVLSGCAVSIALSTGCSRRDLDPTRTPPAAITPPPQGTPAPLKVTLTYSLSSVLSTYPVAVWVADNSGTYLRTLRAYAGNFQYSPSYVLPTWWGADQGRDEPDTSSWRASGTYAEEWDFTDWQGAPGTPGIFRFRVEASNWGRYGTDEVDGVDAVVDVPSIGQETTGTAGIYITLVRVKVHL